MNIDLRIIFGIFKKDLRGMLPLVLLTAALFLIDSILASQDPRDITALLGLLRQYTPWLCMLSCAILIVAVIQLDPAVSLNHDWLARPISAMNLLLAKCLFIGAAILAPLIIARFLVNLSNGYSLLESLLEASFIKNSWIFLVIPIFASAAVLSRTLIHCFGILIGILLVLLALTINTSATVFNPDAFGSETTLTSLVWLIGYVLAVLLFASFLSVYWLQDRFFFFHVYVGDGDSRSNERS